MTDITVHLCNNGIRFTKTFNPLAVSAKTTKGKLELRQNVANFCQNCNEGEQMIQVYKTHGLPTALET